MFSRKSSEKKSASDTVVSVLAAALRRDISFGQLPPDSKLKIEALRARYGGSNHSVREALTLLVSEGLVEATAQRGFRVASATAEDLRDIIRLRAEPGANGAGMVDAPARCGMGRPGDRRATRR